MDRQRQAAVVLGVRDIAGDVKARRKREKGQIFLMGLFFYLKTFRAKGDALLMDASEYLTYLSQVERYLFTLKARLEIH